MADRIAFYLRTAWVWLTFDVTNLDEWERWPIPPASSEGETT